MSDLLITKICRKCQIEKPLEEFDRQTRGRLQRANICKICKSEYNKKKYNSPDFDKENYLLNQKIWNEDHPEKVRDYVRKNRSKDKNDVNNIYPNPLVNPLF